MSWLPIRLASNPMMSDAATVAPSKPMRVGFTG